MTHTQDASIEPMVDAREAADHLNLPLYFLTQQAKRKALKVPHYRIGRLVRFKISELDAWLLATATVGGAPVETAATDEEA